MNILQVSSADVVGGGEVHVMELVARLSDLGHRVSVAGRPGGPLENDHTLRFRNALDLGSAFKLRRIVSRHAYDIVHAHVARDYSIVATALAGLRKPTLVFTRQLIFPVRRHPFYRRVDGWIVTTDQIRDSIDHLKPRNTAIVPNWVDTSKFRFRSGKFSRPLTLGLLGQVSPHKGHDDAIDTMARLGAGYRLLVGGRGEPGYERILRQKAAGLPVEFLGWVRPSEFLERVDVLILPSWEEPFGIVVLEAMAAGVPVIATDAGGPPVILDRGQAGLLVPPRDAAAMATAIRRLESEPGLQSQLRSRAAERVAKHYDIDIVVPQIEGFYERLRGRQLGGP